MIRTEKELLDYLKDKTNLYLYGAGARADYYQYYFKKKEIGIQGFIVSERGQNPQMLGGLPVIALEEFKGLGMESSQLDIIVTMAGDMKKWLALFGEMPAFRSTLFLSAEIQRQIYIRELQYRFEDEQEEYRIDFDYPKIETSQGMLIEKKTGQAIVRLWTGSVIDALDEFLQSATRRRFEEEFGPLTVMPPVGHSSFSDRIFGAGKVEMYVAASHLDSAEITDFQAEGYIPLQVGAVFANIQKCELKDNTGDNISGRNKDYCECTGLYWIWKNTSGQEYTGLCHYRRRLMLDDGVMEYMRDHHVDAVVPHPQYEKETMDTFFTKYYIPEMDQKLLKREVLSFDPDYAPYYEKYERGHFYFPCNVALWKREWFDRYCTFAFAVADKIYAFYKEKRIFREDRYIGYLFEQMETLFLLRHYREMNVICSQIEWLA